MPAVLVELDFICNPTQERFLNSESGQEKMAKSIYNAFVKYKSDYDRKQNAGKRVEESPSSSAVVSPDKKTQTSDSNVKISEQAEKSDRDEIQKQYKKVKSLFCDAFIIKFRDGKRVY